MPETAPANATQLANTPRREGVPAWAIAWFAALVALTIAVRVLDPTGWLGSDDSSYYSAAEHVLTGETMQRVHHHYARMAVVLPVAASVWLFGHSAGAVALPTLIMSTFCVALVVILGRLVWGWWEGLCAGTVVSVLPFFRVLSTTTYPDVHACFWATLAVLLAVLVIRAQRTRSLVLFGIGCGLAVGMTISAKILSATVCIGVVFILCSQSKSRRQHVIAMSSVALGAALLFVIDGLFYVHAADDFFYKLHALANAQAAEQNFNSTSDPGALRVSAWDRMTMLFIPAASQWGILGAAFWPAACAVLLFDRRGRGIALWAIGAYLLIALMPVRLKNGAEPYPFFDGRTVLTTCVPFALSLSWAAHCIARVAFRPAWVRRGWPIALVAVAGLAYADRGQLNGFRDRPTQRVGRAIQQMIALTEWEENREIFLPVSLYMRHRILFPPMLRARLRVAVDNDAPDWWRHATADIVSREKPLPPPDDTYLIATPLQLRGRSESWDYGVTLPRSALTGWRQVTPLARIARFKNKTVGPVKAEDTEVKELLVLLAGENESRFALDAGRDERNNDSAVGRHRTPTGRPTHSKD